MSWKSIKSAPKDGTKILLVVQGFEVCMGHFRDGVWFPLDAQDFFDESMWEQYQKHRKQYGAEYVPTHWMELPEQPTS